MNPLRTCVKCGHASDNLEDFVKDSDGKYGRRNICKECDHDRAQQKGKERRQLIYDLKVGKPCTICGHTFPPCAMDFHHLDPTMKELDISRSLGGFGAPIERVLAELQKCILVCACCHRVIHNDEREEI